MSSAIWLLPWIGMLAVAIWPTKAERRDRADVRSMTRQQRAIESLRRPTRSAAELAPRLRGEGAPADAGLHFPAKAPRSSGTPFTRAAALRGHDTRTVVGSANARHDYRVWDLYDGDDAA